MEIQTVLGLVDANKLMHIQPHEHLMIESGNASNINPDLCIDDIQKSIKEVMDYKKCGGSAILDAQPVGSGRLASDLVTIAQKTDVHIIASTGFHKEMFYWEDHWIHQCSSELLYEMFIEEIENGMFIGNTIETPRERIKGKAGMIKAAIDFNGLTEYYTPKFEAAAQASTDTGVPIMVHIEKGSDPFDIINFLTNQKVKPKQIILCHLDRTHHDYKLHEEIAETGVFLEYDTIGRFKYHKDEKEADLILHMLEKGYSNSLLLSLDTTRSRLSSYNGKIGLTYLIHTFIPRLLNLGVNRETIRLLTYKNPREALSLKKEII